MLLIKRMIMFIKECKSVLLVAFCDVSDMWGFKSRSRIFHSSESDMWKSAAVLQ